MAAPRLLRAGAIALAFAALLVIGLYPTDEKRVKQAAEAIVAAANGTPDELAQALQQHALPEVSLAASELPEPLVGRAALVNAAAQAHQLGQPLRFRVEAVQVFVEGSRARLTADVITMLQPELPELRRPRHSAAVFEKRGGRFRLISAEIGTEQRDQPEARP